MHGAHAWLVPDPLTNVLAPHSVHTLSTLANPAAHATHSDGDVHVSQLGIVVEHAEHCWLGACPAGDCPSMHLTHAAPVFA